MADDHVLDIHDSVLGSYADGAPYPKPPANSSEPLPIFQLARDPETGMVTLVNGSAAPSGPALK